MDTDLDEWNIEMKERNVENRNTSKYCRIEKDIRSLRFLLLDICLYAKFKRRNIKLYFLSELNATQRQLCKKEEPRDTIKGQNVEH